MKVERIKAIYDEIAKYQIDLASNPRSLGPLYLQNTIARCRKYLNSITIVMEESSEERRELGKRLRALEVAHEMSFSELLSSDERIRRLPSIEDRKATANVILRESLNSIANLKAELSDVEFVEKAIKHRHRELNATMSEIKLQRTLIRDEMESGAMYGDERISKHELAIRRAADSSPLGIDPNEINEDEIDAILEQERASQVADTSALSLAHESDSEAETPVSEAPPPIVAAPLPIAAPALPAPEAVSEDGGAVPDDETKVLNFLDSPSGRVKAEDFDDVFENI